MSVVAHSRDMPRQAPSAKEIADGNARAMERRGDATDGDPPELVGGERPGVESRVRSAIEKREAREGDGDA